MRSHVKSLECSYAVLECGALQETGPHGVDHREQHEGACSALSTLSLLKLRDSSSTTRTYIELTVAILTSACFYSKECCKRTQHFWQQSKRKCLISDEFFTKLQASSFPNTHIEIYVSIAFYITELGFSGTKSWWWSCPGEVLITSNSLPQDTILNLNERDPLINQNIITNTWCWRVN